MDFDIVFFQGTFPAAPRCVGLTRGFFLLQKKQLCWLTSKKSPTGPTERTPEPEYLIALAIYLGVRW